MDLLIEWQDSVFFDAAYSKISPDWLGADRSDPVRQFISIYLTVAIGGALLYFTFSGLNWMLIFDKTYLKHVRPKFRVIFLIIYPHSIAFEICL
jgi:hypothetical protein